MLILQVINTLLQKRVLPYKTRFLLHILYTVEDLEFLDAPVHIHVHAVTMHKYKTIIMVLIANIRQITVLPM